VTLGGFDSKDYLDSTRRLERMVSASSEEVYDLLTGYGFARRYVRDRIVADIGSEVGCGTLLLSEIAKSVVGIADSSEVVESASELYPAPNASYRKADFPKLPCADGSFDVAVCFGMIEQLERPAELVEEAKRILKSGGVFLVTMPDRRVHLGERPVSGLREGLFDAEFRELLENHFKYVHMHRSGAMAGGLVFKEGQSLSDASIESGSLSLVGASFDSELPQTRLLMAVCSDAEIPSDEQPYLLLDGDRRVFEECRDRSEDVELLEDEIRRMQESEVQTFQDILKLHRSENFQLEARLKSSEILRKELSLRLREMENSHSWRLLGPYRRLRTWFNTLKKPQPDAKKKAYASGPDKS
jgi:SAM-dependent methyltransferase